MTDDSGKKRSGDWLISPPTYSEFAISISVGEGRKLSRETKDALERLSHSLFAADTGSSSGKCNINCQDFDDCGSYACSPLNGCTVFDKAPCLALVTCQIAEFD